MSDTLASVALSLLKQFSGDGHTAAIHVGHQSIPGSGSLSKSRSPIDGSELAAIPNASPSQVDAVVAASHAAFEAWRLVPGPRRGEFVRRVGERFRAYKSDLAQLITLEAGKITQEALGEVQEMIDIADFAVGLSRQLHGLTIASERPGHRLMEQWHPLGSVGVITAFNFPMAVWAWNAMLAWVCGDSVIWKPSPKTPLCALACQAVVCQVLSEMTDVPPAISAVVLGDRDVSEAICDDGRLPLISATGSVPMGRAVAQRVAARLGRSLLELGGNNGTIITPSADLELAIRSTVFGAAGTCGQRCTTLRRLIVHADVADQVVSRLKSIYARLPIGDPRQTGVLVGPLVDEAAFTAMQSALSAAVDQGGTVHFGQRQLDGVPGGGFYVRPALVEMPAQSEIVKHETFAPILYVLRYESLDEAIAMHNNVPQGLSSSIITSDLREAERFISPSGSDCGIVNVNAGTSGAEIGGAFGGEKETGGGRESGSDSWKTYMRRSTSTINYSAQLPLAQGIQFDV